MLSKKGLNVTVLLLTCIELGFLALPSTSMAANLNLTLQQARQNSMDLAQWEPAPEDAGECKGKKCAGGGSY
jgi:hypothetical protein